MKGVFFYYGRFRLFRAHLNASRLIETTFKQYISYPNTQKAHIGKVCLEEKKIQYEIGSRAYTKYTLDSSCKQRTDPLLYFFFYLVEYNELYMKTSLSEDSTAS